MLKPGTIKLFGFGALCFTAVLIILVFLMPYFILRRITDSLQQTYQFDSNPENLERWSQMPGNRSIVYKKVFRFYNVSPTSYHQITNVTLREALNLTMNKDTKLLDLQFDDTNVKANLNTTYIMPDDVKADGIESKEILQFRPGAFRAIAEIEHRPPT
jgi:hypothetical protein